MAALHGSDLMGKLFMNARPVCVNGMQACRQRCRPIRNWTRANQRKAGGVYKQQRKAVVCVVLYIAAWLLVFLASVLRVHIERCCLESLAQNLISVYYHPIASDKAYTVHARQNDGKSLELCLPALAVGILSVVHALWCTCISRLEPFELLQTASSPCLLIKET
jgi:hypothetical protein